MQTFGAVLDLWPSLEDLARDLGKKGGAVRNWRLRNSIPADCWDALVRAAHRRGLSQVTLEALARIASKRAQAAA